MNFNPVTSIASALPADRRTARFKLWPVTPALSRSDYRRFVAEMLD